MIIVETSVFTRRVLDLLSAEEYRQLQIFLVEYPETGKIIKGSGSLRKIRWSMAGIGKSGGVRVIYYWAVQRSTILMLMIYLKNEQDDLSLNQLKILMGLVEEEYLER